MVWYENSEERFGRSGAKGDIGEKIVENFLIEKSIDYQKVTDPFSQTVLKIDFIINGKLVDVKANMYKDYLGVEVATSSKKRGWIFTTSAEQIYNVDIDKNRIYYYNTKDMQEFASLRISDSKIVSNGARILWVSVDQSFVTQLV